MNKVCKKCNIGQPINNFGPHKGTKDGHATHCRPCDSARHTDYRKKYPERHKAAWVRRGIERHGITQEKYDHLFNSHDGKCWICNGDSNGNRRLSIDHDHSCCKEEYSCGNCVRGLLCMSCNIMIGNLENGQVTLNNIENYLRS